MRHAQIYLFFFICLVGVSCNNKKVVDVSEINLNISIERFDKELNSANHSNLPIKTTELRKKYTWFYDDYMEQIIRVGSPADPAYLNDLAAVLQNKDYLELKSSVELTFPDMSKQEEELTDAFKHIRYYYPKQKIPRLITFISGFDVQTTVGNDYIGMGLDMFLGSNGDKFYPALRQSIPQYIARRFTPQNITPRVLEAFIRENMFVEEDNDRNLLAKMIYNGKILYLLDSFMPELSDTLKIGYTAEQLEWCKQNEGGIWAYFLQNELLFDSDAIKIQKYLAEAPFTPGLGENSDSAPKLGMWTGWQIVRKYMEKNSEVSIQELMLEKDPQKILTASKYKPKI
jgi:gliding motility-associated lipoprotein GldB